MRTLLVAAILISLCACSTGGNYRKGAEVPPTIWLSGPPSNLRNAEATEKLDPEITRLRIEKPIRPVEVIVIDKQLYGWWDEIARRIYIVDKGASWNRKTLIHEWEHARQHDRGEPYDERKAYDAELEAP